MAITIERNKATGSYTATALVEDDYTPFTWFESMTFLFTEESEIKLLFKEHLKAKNLRIVKDN